KIHRRMVGTLVFRGGLIRLNNHGQVFTDSRQFGHIVLQNAETSSRPQHKQIENVINCFKIVNYSKRTVKVSHGKFICCFSSTNPQCSSRKKLPQIKHVVKKQFSFFSGYTRNKAAIVIDSAGTSLFPSFAPS